MDNLPRFIVIAFTFIKPAWLSHLPLYLALLLPPIPLFFSTFLCSGWLHPEGLALFFVLAMALAFHSSSTVWPELSALVLPACLRKW